MTNTLSPAKTRDRPERHSKQGLLQRGDYSNPPHHLVSGHLKTLKSPTPMHSVPKHPKYFLFTQLFSMLRLHLQCFMLCYVMLYVMPYYVMPCYAMLCCIVLCYAMLRYVTFYVMLLCYILSWGSPECTKGSKLLSFRRTGGTAGNPAQSSPL